MPIKNSIIEAYADILNDAYQRKLGDDNAKLEREMLGKNGESVRAMRTAYNSVVSNLRDTKDSMYEYTSAVKDFKESIGSKDKRVSVGNYYLDNISLESITSPDEILRGCAEQVKNNANFFRLLSAARNNKELDTITASIVDAYGIYDYLSNTDIEALHLPDEDA